MKSKKYILLNVRTEIVISLFLVVSILAVYLEVRNYSFNIFDDYVYITKNQHIHSGINFETIKWAFSLKDKKPMYWHPLTWVSHMLDVSLYGFHPGKHHLVNLIFHMINSLMLFYVFWRISGELWKCAFVAILFALHPLNVESVAWIASRKNVLSTFFWMLTILFYFKYTERLHIKHYVLSLLAFSLGLMAKQMLVTLPFVLLLLDFWPIGRLRILETSNMKGSERKVTPFFAILEKMPFIILALMAIYIAALSMRQTGIFLSIESVPLVLRLKNALVSYILYILKMLWPFKLAVFYPFPKSIQLWKVISSIFLLIFMSAISVCLIKNRPYFFVGWFWYLGTMIPMTGIVQAGLWPAMADRWAYIPLIGIFIILTWSVSDLFNDQKYKQYNLTITAFILALLLMSRTWSQTRYWENSFKLFDHAVKISNNNSVAHNNLGLIYAQNGKVEKAIVHYRKAIDINTANVRAYNNLAGALLSIGKIDEAIKHYQSALALKPDYADAYYNLGIAYYFKGNMSNAIIYYKKSIEYDPINAKAHTNLGVAFERKGQMGKAMKHYKAALKIDKKLPEANYYYANALFRIGKIEAAIYYYRKVLEVKPRHVESKKRLKTATELLTLDK